MKYAADDFAGIGRRMRELRISPAEDRERGKCWDCKQDRRLAAGLCVDCFEARLVFARLRLMAERKS